MPLCPACGSNDYAVSNTLNSCGACGSKTLKAHTDSILALAFNPDGRFLASSGMDKTVRLWEMSSGEEVRCLKEHTGPVFGLSFGRGGSLLASGSQDGTVRLWDIPEGGLYRQLEHREAIGKFALSPDGKSVVLGAGGKRMILCGLSETVTIRDLREQSIPPLCIAFSPDGARVLTVSPDLTVRSWETTGGRIIAAKRMKKESESAWNAVLSEDSRFFASAGQGAVIRVWEIATAREVGRFDTHTSVNGIAFSADGRYLVSGGMDRAAQLWNISSGIRERNFVGHSAEIYAVAFGPDGRCVASAGEDRRICLWSL